MKQQQALEILKTNENVFLTGSAGSGKTYVLNKYTDYLRQKGINVAVTATTGIAATHLGGTTIHSWSGLGIKDKLTEHDFNTLKKKRHLLRHFLTTNVLIIDEISMLHAHQLDLVNELCQAFRQNLKPFGGLKVVLAGDFFQLPPVAKGDQPVKMVTAANIWPAMNLKVCYLDEQYRQADVKFIQLLNEIRQNNLSLSSRLLLLGRLNQTLKSSLTPAKLYTHNIDVEALNAAEINKISGPAKAYSMQTRGNSQLAMLLQKGCLAPEKLVLKIGAKVMFVKNNFEQGVVNGTLGKVVDFDDNSFPVVETNSGERLVAAPTEWSIEEDGKIKAAIKQIPLRLAWAITVHKSQGLSLDLVETDLSKSFVPGMGYVALSRVRTLNGLRLVGINELALQVNPEVLAMDQTFISSSKQAEFFLAGLSAEEKIKSQFGFINNNKTSRLAERRDIKTRLEKTKQMIITKKSLEEMAQTQGFRPSTIIGHVEKLLAKGIAPDISYLLPDKEDCEKIKDAFLVCGADYLKPVFEHLVEVYPYETLRLVRAWLVASQRIKVD